MGIGKNNKYYSVRRNSESAPPKFHYNSSTGMFGNDGNHDSIREITSSDPVKAAKELFAILTRGGEKYRVANPNVEAYILPDMSIVTMRTITRSGSPAVEINIKNNPFTTRIQNQKIHLTRKEKKR